MAETLRSLDELIASFPDNSTGLITAVTQRDHVVSTTDGFGYLADATDVIIPIVDGVPVAVNPLLVAPISTTQLWVFDGNNLGVNNYGAVADLTIPPGYSKLVSLLAVLSVEKLAAGADNYSIQFARDGVGFGLDAFFTFAAAGAQVLTIVTSDVTDISTIETYGVQLTGQGTADDLTVHSFEMTVRDSILLTAP